MAPRPRDYHAEYLARTKGQRTGAYRATHRPPGTAQVYLEGRTEVTRVELSYGEARRAGRFDSLTQRLLAGDITEAEFDRRTSRWAPLRVTGGDVPAGRYRFARADEVIFQYQNYADLPDEERERPWFDIEGS